MLLLCNTNIGFVELQMGLPNFFIYV